MAEDSLDIYALEEGFGNVDATLRRLVNINQDNNRDANYNAISETNLNQRRFKLFVDVECLKNLPPKESFLNLFGCFEDKLTLEVSLDGDSRAINLSTQNESDAGSPLTHAGVSFCPTEKPAAQAWDLTEFYGPLMLCFRLKKTGLWRDTVLSEYSVTLKELWTAQNRTAPAGLRDDRHTKVTTNNTGNNDDITSRGDTSERDNGWAVKHSAWIPFPHSSRSRSAGSPSIEYETSDRTTATVRKKSATWLETAATLSTSLVPSAGPHGHATLNYAYKEVEDPKSTAKACAEGTEDAGHRAKALPAAQTPRDVGVRLDFSFRLVSLQQCLSLASVSDKEGVRQSELHLLSGAGPASALVEVLKALAAHHRNQGLSLALSLRTVHTLSFPAPAAATTPTSGTGGLAAKSRRGYTALEVALLRGNSSVAMELLRRAGYLCFRDRDIRPKTHCPYHCAVLGGDVHCLELLIRFLKKFGSSQGLGASGAISSADAGTGGPHDASSTSGTLSWSQSFSQQLNWRDEEDRTPLALACQLGGRTALVRLLIENGADCDSQSGLTHYTPLMFAAERGDREAVQLLLGRRRSAQELNDSLFLSPHPAGTARDSALAQHLRGNARSRTLLLTHRDPLAALCCAPWTRVPLTGKTALLIAANKGHVGVVLLLLRAGVSPVEVDSAGRNLFHLLMQHRLEILGSKQKKGSRRVQSKGKTDSRGDSESKKSLNQLSALIDLERTSWSLFWGSPSEAAGDGNAGSQTAESKDAFSRGLRAKALLAQDYRDRSPVQVAIQGETRDAAGALLMLRAARETYAGALTAQERHTLETQIAALEGSGLRGTEDAKTGTGVKRSVSSTDEKSTEDGWTSVGVSPLEKVLEEADAWRHDDEADAVEHTLALSALDWKVLRDSQNHT